jgi:hypothetical protein
MSRAQIRTPSAGRFGQYGQALTALQSHASASASEPDNTTLGPLGSKSTCAEGPSASMVRRTSLPVQSQTLTCSPLGC